MDNFRICAIMITKAKILGYFARKKGAIMAYEEKTVRKNYIYQGKILSLRCDDALTHDGKACKREIVEHGGGACVLYIESGRVLFVRQYRYAYGEEVLEIPAGKLVKGEDPKTTAIRELEEETGIRVKDAELLFVLYPTPGYTNEKIYIYGASAGEKVSAHLDEGEYLDVVWLSIEEAKKALQTGELHDAKTIVALQRYLLG